MKRVQNKGFGWKYTLKGYAGMREQETRFLHFCFEKEKENHYIGCQMLSYV